jgi:hypothetical protein
VVGDTFTGLLHVQDARMGVGGGFSTEACLLKRLICGFLRHVRGV